MLRTSSSFVQRNVAVSGLASRNEAIEQKRFVHCRWAFALLQVAV